MMHINTQLTQSSLSYHFITFEMLSFIYRNSFYFNCSSEQTFTNCSIVCFCSS